MMLVIEIMIFLLQKAPEVYSPERKLESTAGFQL